MRWMPRPHEIVAVFDRRLQRWRRAQIVAVNVLQRLYTAKAGNVWFSEEAVHPRNIRPIRLVYCRRCDALRRAA